MYFVCHDIVLGKEIKTFDGHNSSVVSIVFSKDNRFMIIATSGSFDNTIKLWDILTTKDSITLIAKLENR